MSVVMSSGKGTSSGAQASPGGVAATTAGAAEAAAIGVLAIMSLMIAGLSLLHFLDYYVLQLGTISKIQLLRLSPVITLFGAISLVTALTTWERERQSDPQRRMVLRPARVGLILVALIWSGYYMVRWPSAYRFAKRITANPQHCPPRLRAQTSYY